MKINDSANVIAPNPTVGKANSSPNSQANTNINPADAKTNVTGPAANIDISLTAKLAEVQGDSPITKSTDQALIRSATKLPVVNLKLITKRFHKPC